MPIIDLEPPDVLAPRMAPPKGKSITPGADDIEYGSDAPNDRPAWSSNISWSDAGREFIAGTLSGSPVTGLGRAAVRVAGQQPAVQAAFRQDNTIGAMFAREERDTAREPGFNPWEAIKGTPYEASWDSFVSAHNPRETDRIKRKIDQEREDRKLLDGMPWYQSLPLQMTASVLDWPTLLPGGAFVRGAQGGFSVGRSALNVGVAAGASTGVQEATLQGLQETRPLSESAVNIGASMFLGGLLGAGGAKLLSPPEWSGAVRAVERELAGFRDVPDAEIGARMADEIGAPGSMGAAAVAPVSLEENTIAGRAAGAVAAAAARLNPLLRALHSPSAAWRDISTKLVENPIYLKKNFAGVASEPAVETLMKEWNSGLAKAVQATDGAWAEHRKAGGQLDRHEFREAVGHAMRNGDVDADPHITKVAQAWRSQVFDPLKDAAIAAKLLPADVSVETAASYFSRMWNRNRLIARESEFKGIVSEWLRVQAPRWAHEFDQETAVKSAKLNDEKLAEYLLERRLERDARFDDMPGAIRGIVNEVYNTLTGRTSEGVRPEFITVKARGPLKERTFNIPDRLVENFLESDVDIVGRRYARIMGADIEIANKFGSVDMAEQGASIRADYDRLRSATKSERRLTELGNKEKRDIADLEYLRDQLRGASFSLLPHEQKFSSIVRSFNHFNYIRSMGEVALASLTESIRPAMVHGLMPYMSFMGQLATNLNGIKLSVREAQLAGNIYERVLGHRLATISEISDPYASRGPVEAFLENMTNVASKWNGIRLLTDMQKTASAVMTQNRLLSSSIRYGKISGKERAYLNWAGIDESMASRIAKQFETHGETDGGIKIANTEQWTDSVAKRVYRAAMNKDVDSIITTKGVADVPKFASTPTGRATLQFKTFFLASHQRVLLRGLQEDQARFVGGLVAMTGIGMMVTYLKAISGNRQEKLADFSANPGWWIAEGLDKTGIFSVPMELANAIEKASGLNPIKTPIRAFDEGSRMSQRVQNRSEIGAWLGPTVGLGQDIITTAGIPRRWKEGEEITQGQQNAAERLLPFNSYLGIRQTLRYLQAPQ